MNLEFLKARYDFELERKDELTGALAIPVESPKRSWRPRHGNGPFILI